jgi:hypothetical protein
MPEATKMVEAVVKTDTMKSANMGAAKVASAETAAVATTMREGRRWHHEQGRDRKSFKHRGTPGCPSPVLLVAVGAGTGSITTTTTVGLQRRTRGVADHRRDRQRRSDPIGMQSRVLARLAPLADLAMRLRPLLGPLLKFG